jgi:hypothetical protein
MSMILFLNTETQMFTSVCFNDKELSSGIPPIINYLILYDIPDIDLPCLGAIDSALKIL